LNRRAWLFGAAGAATSVSLAPIAFAQDGRIYHLRVARDANCGCCHAWTEEMRRSGRFRTSLTDVPDMPALKRRLGVPDDLASCHTGTVEGYVIEGHVPVEEVLRLLRERPARVHGLAVAGMPRGAPGMESSDGAHDPFTVYAFETGGARRAFARYGGGA
jgi:hypothetical protein